MTTDFDEQAFLLDFIDKFKNKITNPDTVVTEITDTPEGSEEIWTGASKIPTPYQHVLRIMGEPDSSVNKLSYSSSKISSTFDSFTPHQLSALTPKIEIYKRKKIDDKWHDIPFPINQATTSDSILKSLEGRGTDVALRSITWRDTGVDPAYAGVTFEGRMSFTFQSFESLFMERETHIPGQTISFAELTTNAPTNLKKSPGNEHLIGVMDANGPALAPFEIKLVVGWSAPTQGPKENLFSPGQISDIREAQAVLNITTNRIELKIGDGGKVDLDCQFIGRLEASLLTQKYDLFMTDVYSLEHQKTEQSKRTLYSVKKTIGNLLDEEKNLSDSNDKKVQMLEDSLKLTSEELFQIKSENLEDAWSKLLNRINSMSSPDDGNSRLFYVDITNDTLKEYENLLKLRAANAAAKSKNRGTSEKLVAEGKLKKFADDRTSGRQKILDTLEANKANDTTVMDSKKDQFKKAKNPEEWKAALQKKNEETDSEKLPPDNIAKRINFFYLGDLFEAAMDIVINRPSSGDCASGVSGKNNPDSKKMKDETRLMVGTIYIIDPESRNLRLVSLADIPISVDKFLQFWNRIVVQPRLGALPLRKFLQLVCAQLVSAVLGVQPVGKTTGRRPSSRIKATTLHLPKDGVVDEIWEKYRKVMHIDAVAEKMNKGNSNKDGKSQETVSFIYLYSDEKPQRIDNAINQYDDNIKNGIPHLYVGNNDGIVKSIKFDRTKIQGHHESSILQAVKAGQTGVRSQLLSSDKYDAAIEMFGNPFYKPGLQIYVDPQSLGLGYSVPRDWAVDLGLGGHYTVHAVENNIKPGSYTTKLAAKSEIGLNLRKIVKQQKGAGTPLPGIDKKGGQ